MRFSEGMWRNREGIHPHWMGNVQKVTEQDGNIRLLLTKPHRHVGDQLNNPTITAVISSPGLEVIGVKLTHWAGAVDVGPHFKLNTSKGHAEIRKSTNILEYRTGNLKLSVNTSPNNFDIKFTNDRGKKLTSHSSRSVGYITDETNSPFTDGLYREFAKYAFAALDVGVQETFYGLGERFGPFVKNGQSVEMSNEDGGTSSQLTYKNIPFYISSKGYGVFVNNPGKVSFEVQSERTTRVNMSVPGESIEYFVIYGPTPKEVISKYTALTGRAAIPPSWTYNLWLTTSFTTNYNEQTVTGFLDGFKERDIPLGTFHFDAFWMKGYQWCDFEFDADIFPNVKDYLKRLKDRGMKLCVWLNSYVAQESRLFEEGKKNEYFIKRLDGSVWQWDNWQAGMAIVDFTNPDACKWYQGYLRELIHMGIDSFKTDFGERIPFKNVKYYNGADPAGMHNYYTQLYNRTVHEVLNEELGPNKGCLFARSATAGGQQFPVHWGGDCESTFEAMAETLRGGLSLGLSGFAFWAHDIGGFEGTPPPALYKRWCQFGLLSSHSRLHGSGSFRVPWIYDEDASDVLRDCVNRKLSLLPYLLQAALEAHNSGTPVMRASFVEFPNDKNTYSVDTQFFLGSNLLVAPVFSESGEVFFYVPEGDGEWVSWFDKTKRYAGGRWYTETHDFFSLPLLVRPGTVTLVNPTLRDSVSDYRDGLQVLINGNINEVTEVPLVDVENPGQTTGIVRATPRGKDLIIDGPGAGKNWSVTYLGKGKCNSEGGTTTEGSGFVAHTTPATSVVLSLE